MNATSRNGFLGPAKSAGYSPKVYGYTQSINSQRPYFQLANVPEMLQDEQIQFGLGAIYAPLNRITWETKCDKPEVKQFIDQQLGKVLTHGLQHLRRCVEYGQIGAEVLYTTEDNRIVFDSLVKFEALDTTPLELESKVVGVRVRGTKYGVCDIGFPRFIWTVNQPIGQGAVGVSRLATAWIPWIEKGGRNGARDIVRLHMIRNSSRGDSLYYPEGQSNVAPEGASPVYVNNQDLARQLVEQIMAGGTVCFPNGRDEKGEYQWVMKPPVGVAPGEGLLDWLKRLDHDILRGMKVPPEVLEATGETGSGYAGRSIPMDVFYNSEDELVRQIVSSIVEYIIRWLVWANFGRVRYTVTPKSVAPQPPQMPGQGQGAPPTPGGGGGGSQADPAKVGAGKPVSRANTGWQPYHGPRGGQGFYNPQTGRVRYGRVPLSLSRAGRNPLLARVRAAKGTNTKALAEFHAGLWNMLLAGGLNVPDAELEKVAVELARGPWAIIFDKKHGRWAVVHSGEEDNRVQFAIRHSPVGGVSLRGVFYRGGEFIPDDVYDSLNANERAELERSSQASNDRLSARGDVTRESVQQRTGRYAKPAQGGKITADELQQAKGLAHAIHRQYGELSLHRLDEIAEYLENAANALPASESGLKAHYQRRLGVLHHAATNLGGMVKRAGLLGGYKVHKSGDPKMPYQVTRARDNMAWLYKDRKEAVSNARRMFQLDKDVHARTGPAREMPSHWTNPKDFAEMMADAPAKPTGAEFPAGDFGKMMGDPAKAAPEPATAEPAKPDAQASPKGEPPAAPPQAPAPAADPDAVDVPEPAPRSDRQKLIADLKNRRDAGDLSDKEFGQHLLDILDGKTPDLGDAHEGDVTDVGDFGGFDEDPAAGDNVSPRAGAAKAAPATPTGANHAADLLDQAIYDMKSADPDHEAIRAQVDAVGQWAAAQKTQTPLIRKILTESHSLADKLSGGSGKGGNRIEINPDVAPAKPGRVTVPPAGSTLTTPNGEYTMVGQHPDGTATVKDESGKTVKLTPEAVKAAEVTPPAEPERIPGGMAEGRPDAAFPPDKLAAGAKVESEHTTEPEVAQEIAKDHLAEDPNYYEKLKAVETPKPAKAPKAPAVRDFPVVGTRKPMAPVEFIKAVIDGAKKSTDTMTNRPYSPDAIGGHKAFIAEIYDAAKDQLGGMSLDDFKQNLIAANRAGGMFLGRLDLISGVERSDKRDALTRVNDSRAPYMHTEFHTVHVPTAEEAVRGYEQLAAARPPEPAQDSAAPQQASGPQKPAEVSPPPGDTVSPRTPSADQHLALADALAGRLAAGSITAKDLWAAADQAYGGTRAEGAYGPSEAYDALEAGFNKSLAGKTDPGLDLAAAQSQAREIADRVAALPTQTNRSGTKDSFQQFSTPPHYAYAVNWIANPKGGDLVLEPSAGTASLAVHAKNGGADVVVNELDPRRAGFLKAMFGPDKVHTENADHLDAILSPRGVKPTVVVMNPPFSQTAGRMGDKKDLMVGANHIEQAFKMLPDGGRLVAIVGRGMTPDAPTFRGWFAKMGQRGTLRANVGVGGNEYSKYGTRFGTRVLVFDKVKSGAAPVLGDAADIPDLMAKLEGVRNDRPQIAGSAPGQPAGGAVPGTPGGRPGPGGNAAGATAWGPPQPVADGGRTPGAGGGTVATPAGPSGGVSGAGPTGTPARTGGGRGPVAGPGGAPELAPGGPQAGAEGERRGGGAGGEPAEQPRAGGVAAPRLVQPAPVETPASGPKSNADLGNSLYETYRPPFVHFEGAKDHKTPLVESAAMSAVDPPQPKVTPNIPKELITSGKLSNAQLENLVYATQAHETYLPAGPGEVRFRRGHMNGDGTGVGKGRQNAAIIIHNFNEGRRKAVWLSLKANLIDDAARDWTALGMSKKDLHPFRALKRKKPPQDGVLFVTYDTLRDGGKKAGSKSNLQALLDWLGPDFDGVMIMDEAHAMGNAMPTVGGSGRKKNASLRATAGVALQEKLPEARVEYASATGATEVANLAYAQRLGLWGRGTPFPTAQDFINQMTRGGTAAMEQVAQSLKATGAYNARSLSFDGVTYQNVNHALTPDQQAVYNGAAEAWQTVIANIDNALEAAGAKGSRAARLAAESQLWSAQQRFFNQLITAIMTPTVINSIEGDLKNGLSPVVQLINTGESATNRALQKRKDEGVDENESLEDLDVGPRDVLVKYLDDAFPVHKWEEYVDPQTGAKSWRKVTDSEGNYVVDPEAVQIREQMKDMVMSIRLPEAPLDMIVNHFGHDTVAEATGRKKRIVWQEQSDGTKKKVQVSRGSDSSKANAADTEDYQAGRKKIMVFSAAGGTGKSYHSDRDAKNQKQRTHYILQAGWQADAATQGFGRTHRTNQASPPIYKLMTVDKLKAQKRFVSSIARRLEQLGALTKGQRQTGGGGMFSAADNLESPLAMRALSAFWQDVSREGIGSMTAAEVMRQLAFRPNQNGAYEEPTIRRFLNRMLSTSVDVQNQIFDAFNEHIDREVQRALDSGTLDTGVENFKAQNIAKVGERVVYTEPNSGAKVRLLTTKATRKTEPRPWESNEQGELPLGFVTNNQSGKVYAVYKGADETDAKTGNIIPKMILRGVMGRTSRPAHEVRGPNFYSEVGPTQARALWQQELAEAPATTTTDEYFLVGATLPIWDRIPGADHPQIFRILTDDGQTAVGRHITKKQLPVLLRNLGAGGAEGDAKVPPHETIHAHLSAGRGDVTLANGWRIRPVRVGGEKRIELTGPNYAHERELMNDGVVKERVRNDNRLFIPVGRAGVEVLRRITANRPIAEVGGMDAGDE